MRARQSLPRRIATISSSGELALRRELLVPRVVALQCDKNVAAARQLPAPPRREENAPTVRQLPAPPRREENVPTTRGFSRRRAAILPAAREDNVAAASRTVKKHVYALTLRYFFRCCHVSLPPTIPAEEARDYCISSRMLPRREWNLQTCGFVARTLTPRPQDFLGAYFDACRPPSELAGWEAAARCAEGGGGGRK